MAGTERLWSFAEIGMVLAVLRRTWSAARECLSPDRSRRAKCLESFTDRRRHSTPRAPRPQPGSTAGRFAHVSGPLLRPQLRRGDVNRAPPTASPATLGDPVHPTSAPGSPDCSPHSGQAGAKPCGSSTARRHSARGPGAGAARPDRGVGRRMHRTGRHPPHTGHRVAARRPAFPDPAPIYGRSSAFSSAPTGGRRGPRTRPSPFRCAARGRLGSRRRTDPHAVSRARDATDLNEQARTTNGVSPRVYWSPSSSS